MTGPVIHGRAGRTPLPLCSELTIRSPYAAPFEFCLSGSRSPLELCLSLLHLCTRRSRICTFALHVPATCHPRPQPATRNYFYFCTFAQAAGRFALLHGLLSLWPTGHLVNRSTSYGPPTRLHCACFAAVHHASSPPSAFPVLDTPNSRLYLPTCLNTALVIPSRAAGE
jgi:hypothetical protein